MEREICGAVWSHYLDYEGLFVSKKMLVAQVVCTINKGHYGDHEGRLPGEPRKAVVTW
jgi:hypothetical protein